MSQRQKLQKSFTLWLKIFVGVFMDRCESSNVHRYVWWCTIKRVRAHDASSQPRLLTASQGIAVNRWSLRKRRCYRSPGPPYHSRIFLRARHAHRWVPPMGVPGSLALPASRSCDDPTIHMMQVDPRLLPSCMCGAFLWFFISLVLAVLLHESCWSCWYYLPSSNNLPVARFIQFSRKGLLLQLVTLTNWSCIVWFW